MISINHYTTEEVKKRVADHFGIPGNYILLNRNAKRIYIYCLWMFSDLKQREIAVEAQAHGSSISDAISSIKRRCLQDRKFRAEVIAIENLFE